MSAEKVGTTPGPWRVDEHNHCVIESARHGNIAIVNLARMSAADAHLIASAPDLLALAKRYASKCGMCGGTGRRMALGPDGSETHTVACAACADIRAVIEKAEGGA